MLKKECFIYIWYDRKHKRYYIGSHFKGHENDGYICSSTNMIHAYKRRPQDFKRRILQRMNCTHKELLEQEMKWLSLIRDEDLGKRYYNFTKKTGHWASSPEKKKSVGQRCSERQRNDPNWANWNKGIIRSDETKYKIKQARAKQVITEEHKQKISKTMSGKPGHKHTEETKKLLSEIKKQRIADGLFVHPRNNLGKVTSEATKAKISESLKRRYAIKRGELV